MTGIPMTSTLRPALVILAALSALTGLCYPVLVTAAGQLAFPKTANGSPLQVGGRVVGSALLGQEFRSDGNFWCRPSATTPAAYDATASSGSNLGPTNPALREAIEARRAALTSRPTKGQGPVPVDLVTASASGLDPDISAAAALWQVPRVATARGIQEAELRTLVLGHVEHPWLGCFGTPHVNVLRLNLALAARR